MSEQTIDITELYTDLAIPVAQLSLYRHLWATDNLELRATDLLAVNDQILEVLKRHGMKFVGSIGTVEPFDKTKHDLVVHAEVEDGQPVEICLHGVNIGDRILTRMGVRPSTV